MPTPHKHASAIKAWADGHPLQYRRHAGADWKDVADPTWNLAGEYRVKPVLRVLQYRCFIRPAWQDPTWGSEVGVVTWHEGSPEPKFPADGFTNCAKMFTRWIHDSWQLVVFEEDPLALENTD